MKNQPQRNYLQIFHLLVTLVLAVVAGFFFYKYQDAKDQIPVDPQVASANLVAEINEIYELPSGEEPQIYTINDDVEQLKSQAFFANAQSGDKLLVYQEAKQAFLYRPSTKKIINAGPITINDAASSSALDQEQSQTDNTKQPASVRLIGSSQAIASTKQKLTNLLSGQEVNDVQPDELPTDTLVVDVTANATSLASEIASELSAQLSTTVPSEYASAGADILIIISE